MKLLTRTSIYYLIFLLNLFLAAGIIFYSQLKEIIDEDFTEDIYMEKEQVLQFVNDSARIPQQSLYFGDKVLFLKETALRKEQLIDTLLFNPLEEEYQPYRQLIFPVKIEEQDYSVIIMKPMFESDDLIDAIVFPLFFIAVIMLILLFLLTRVLSKEMWKPFYKTLEILQGIDLSSKEKIKFSPVKISEFSMLNSEIEKMTERIQHDYQNLKEFTENASHEIQTPLAIICSKLELMIQSENLTPEQMKFIQDMYESTNRLSKLNQSLLLLAKIENRQFNEMQIVDLKTHIKNKLNQFEEMIVYKNLRVEKKLNTATEVKMNEQLADILLSNIIGNAIKHNNNNGEIIIELTNNALIISNTGNALEIPAEKLFERFSKGSQSADSTGLGLAIVKQICNTCNLRINYSHSKELHTITVHF